MDDSRTKVAKTFDSYENSYTQTVDRAVAFSGFNVDFFIKVKAKYITDLAKKHFGKTEHLSVIDIGCGVGSYHSLIGDCFGSITGVDVSAASIETAISKNPRVNYVVYPGDELPFASGTFDVAYTVCVIHHVPPESWRKFASEMQRVLKPGGLALVFEHNPYNPLTMRAVNNCPFDEDAVLLTKSETEDLLGSVGFKEISSRFILSVPPRGWLLDRLDRAMSAIPIGAQYIVSAQA